MYLREKRILRFSSLKLCFDEEIATQFSDASLKRGS